MSDTFSNLDPASERATTPSARAGETSPSPSTGASEPATTPLSPAAGPAPATGPTPATGPASATGPAVPTEPTSATGPAPVTPDTTSGATMAFGASAVPAPRRNRPLFGTIFWGVVLLTFAGLMVVQALFPVTLDPTLWLVGSVLVIGLLLVVAGIAAATRRAG